LVECVQACREKDRKNRLSKSREVKGSENK
jgi:hypothetical protein